MKIAILGNSALALKCLMEFRDLGAEVVLFTNKKVVSVDSLKVIQGKVLRVQKRFLSKGEKFDNRSRLLDLFRVVYEFSPSLDEEENENKVLLDKLKENKIDLSHLKEKMERFYDFDLVIDLLTDHDFPRPMGAAGTFALNEERLKNKGRIFYGLDELPAFTNYIETSKNSSQTLATVGSGDTALKALLALGKKNYAIHLITKEDKAFANLTNPTLKDEYKVFMKNLLKNYESEKEVFTTAINKWKGLADFEIVKVPKPQEPSFPLSLHAGCSVSTVDYLSDQNALFLTVEKPDYTASISSHQTLSCSAVFVATGYEKDYSYLQSLNMKDFLLLGEEEGFYHVRTEEEIPLVIENVMKFFSKVN